MGSILLTASLSETENSSENVFALNVTINVVWALAEPFIRDLENFVFSVT
jgi:hypothetical protein